MRSQLASYFRDCGFSIEHVEAKTIPNTDLDGTVAGYVMDLCSGQMEASGEGDPAEIAAWEQDFRDIDENRETFFNVTQYRYIGRKPT